MLLRLNDHSDVVRDLQAKLGLVTDGFFGPVTQAAVIAFQQKNGLHPDGIVGDATFAKLNIHPQLIVVQHKLTTQDFIRSGQLIQCHPGLCEALALKETHGDAFLPDGRPKILFERHIFYKRFPIVRKSGQTQAQLLADREVVAKVNPDICSPSRGGYKGGAAEYERLARAQGYSDTAALESASWGQFQIMGFNARAMGYSTVQEFVRTQYQGVDQHLVALSRFILATPKALKAIRAGDAAGLAAAYNGPAYKENHYDTDLIKYFDQVKGKYA